MDGGEGLANISACLSSKSDDWATPQDFYDNLNREFHFDLDPCADDRNHKCDLYFTREQDGLKQNWGGGIGCSAIPLMVAKSVSGCGIPMNRHRSLTHL